MAVSMDGGLSFTNMQVSDPGFKFNLPPCRVILQRAIRVIISA